MDGELATVRKVSTSAMLWLRWSSKEWASLQWAQARGSLTSFWETSTKPFFHDMILDVASCEVLDGKVAETSLSLSFRCACSICLSCLPDVVLGVRDFCWRNWSCLLPWISWVSFLDLKSYEPCLRFQSGVDTASFALSFYHTKDERLEHLFALRTMYSLKDDCSPAKTAFAALGNNICLKMSACKDD
jgi:hypothetical protein